MKRDASPMEVREASQWFVPFDGATFKRKSEALAELARPCGRFKPVLPLEKKIAIKLAESVENSALLGGQSLIFSQGVPSNWQALLNYLHKKEIIATPRFYEKKFSSDRPKANSLLLSPYDSLEKTDGRKVNPNGLGTALSLEEAMSKAVGEVLERYFLTLYRREALYEFSRASLLEDKKNFLDPASLNGFLPWQKKMFSDFVWHDDTPFRWVNGEELIGGNSALIPAQLVYWNYKCEDGEPVLAGPTTSGAAGHFTKSEAILAALLENIERDGFLIYWLNSISPDVIDVSLIEDEEVEELLAYLKRYRLEAYFLNTTTDVGVPSCVCAIIDSTRGAPVISLGGSAGFNLAELIMRSAGEAVSVNESVDKGEKYILSDTYKPFTDGTIRRKERLLAWKGQEMYERFKFFISGKKQDPISFMNGTDSLRLPKERLGHIYKRFAEMGESYKVYCYEVKNDVLDTLGYHVVRTVVPPFIPLYLDERVATLDSKRLREVPQKLGYKITGNMNPWPHPFP